MPSACTKPDTKASNEASNQIEKCVTIVEKKVRNLEKRKLKLDGYRAKKKQGEELNEDQQEAISKYDGVIQNLEFARELHKQFQVMSGEVEKLAKKKVKREKVERQEQEVTRIRELLQLQELLSNMGSDDIREDFKTGANGAVKVTAENLEQMDEIYKLITPTREGDTSYLEQLTQASEHIVCFLDGREKEVAGTTYKDLKELAEKINSCGYFESLGEREEPVVAPAEESVAAEIPEAVESPKSQQQEVVVESPKLSKPSPDPVPVQPLPTMEPSPPSHVQEERPGPGSAAMSAAIVNGPPILPESEVSYEDNSFFTTPNFSTRPRGFQEIVSSVQGNFNFIQDSELDVESPHRIDPAVVAARPMAQGISRSHVSDAVLMPQGYQGSSLLSNEDQTASAASTFSQQMAVQSVPDTSSHHAAAQPVSQSQHVTSDSLDFGAAATPSMAESLQSASAQLQFGAVDSIVHDSQSSSLSSGPQQSQSSLEAAYSQNLMSQSLGASGSSQHYGDQSASTIRAPHMGLPESSVDTLGSASSSAVPQPIPMPNEALPGQSLMSQAFTKSDSAASSQQEKKAYRMNPNADPFKSTAMFSNTGSMSSGLQATSSTTQSSAPTGALVDEASKTAWNTITQQRPQHQPQHGNEQQDSQPDFSTYNNSGSMSSRGGQRGGRGYNRGGGSAGNRGSNGFPRGGSRGGGPSVYSGNRGDSSSRGFPNGRGGNRGMRGGPQRGGAGGRGGRGGPSGGFSRSPYTQ